VIFWPRPALHDGETSVLEERASYARGGLARGGLLVLTDRRLIFQPNRLEAWTLLKPSTWPRTTIQEVAVAPTGEDLLAGGWRRRLQITLTDGRRAVFVVPRVDELQARLAAALKP